MASENRLAILIFVALLGALVLLLAANALADLRRHTIRRVVVVSATDLDPVFRTGARVVDDDTTLTVATALLVERRWSAARWYAPGPDLVIDGRAVETVEFASWPEDDRELRIFWFTLEAPTAGGLQTPTDLRRITQLRPFLAPELGLGMVARGSPELHAAGGLAPLDGELSINAGTYRLMARAEIAVPGQLRPLHTVTSPGADDPEDPSVCRISRRLDPTWGLAPAAGELFRLPSIEPPLEGPGNSGAIDDLTARRIAVSSRSFAAEAPPLPEPTTTVPIRLSGDAIAVSTAEGQPLRWGEEAETGTTLRAGIHWLVLVRDDGDGRVNGADLVVQAWRRPPVVVPLASAVAPGETFELVVPAPVGDGT